MLTRRLHKIPVTVVTGLLGAGKTTLIRHLLENNRGRRIAIIINEFGDIGVDRALLEGCGAAACAESIIELANGCLCCTVADAFLPVMERLANRVNPPDHIVIETSGLALPTPLVQAFQWPTLRSRVTVDGVVVIVDAAAMIESRFADASIWKAVQGNSAHDKPLAEVFAEQLLCADIVLLNKTDLLESDGPAKVARDLSLRLRAGVRLLAIHQGQVDSDLLLGLRATMENAFSSARLSCHDAQGEHDHDDFESFSLTLPAIADPEALETRLRAVITAHNILRVKGFLDVPGRAMRLVMQSVGPRIQRYFDQRWGVAEPRCSRLVVIGLKGLNRCDIAAALGACT